VYFQRGVIPIYKKAKSRQKEYYLFFLWKDYTALGENKRNWARTSILSQLRLVLSQRNSMCGRQRRRLCCLAKQQQKNVGPLLILVVCPYHWIKNVQLRYLLKLLLWTIYVYNLLFLPEQPVKKFFRFSEWWSHTSQPDRFRNTIPPGHKRTAPWNTEIENMILLLYKQEGGTLLATRIRIYVVSRQSAFRKKGTRPPLRTLEKS
jgi:hypothetical protein